MINDKNGIKDCFGLSNVATLEYSLIIKKFSGNIKPLSITFETGLALLNESEKLTFERNNVLPYEYVCWREILFDVPNTLSDDNDFIQKALEILPQKNCDLDALLKTDVLSKLFFLKNDNKSFDKLVVYIDEKLSSENINLNDIECILKENIVNVFDKDTKDLYIKRLEKTAFILMSNSNKLASHIYNLTKNEKILNKFFLEILKKSLFVFYQIEFQNKMDKKNDNIFMKKAQKQETSLSSKKIEKLLENILEEWAKDE